MFENYAKSRFVISVLFSASEKGDTSENRDPNCTISNGKVTLDSNSNAENVKSHMEPPLETACSSESESCLIPEQVEFIIMFNKIKYDITFGYDSTILELKAHLERICGVPHATQKLIVKGMARNSMSLRKAGIVKGSKVMLVGSKMDDILAVKTAPKVCK